MKGFDCTDGSCPCRYCGTTKPCTEFLPSVSSSRGHTLQCIPCNRNMLRTKHGSQPRQYAPPKPCPWCGTTFKTDHQRSRYCSRSCLAASRRKPDASKIYVGRCRQCARAFTARRSKRFCTRQCTNLYGYRQTFVPVPPRPAACIDCGQAYIQRHGLNTRCASCLEDRQAALRTLTRVRRRTRELTNGPYEQVNPRLIYERDKWTCYICHHEVDPTAPNNHPRQATLDHVWPLSLGGTHTADNLRLACRQCNTHKGAGFLIAPTTTRSPRKRSQHARSAG